MQYLRSYHFTLQHNINVQYALIQQGYLLMRLHASMDDIVSARKWNIHTTNYEETYPCCSHKYFIAINDCNFPHTTLAKWNELRVHIGIPVYFHYKVVKQNDVIQQFCKCQI